VDSAILPQVENKGGELTDVNNYRAVALSNAETKILETLLFCVISMMLMIVISRPINLVSGKNARLECVLYWCGKTDDRSNTISNEVAACLRILLIFKIPLTGSIT